MAINFLNNVDYNQNQLLHPTIENQANDAAAGTPVDGQLYYNTSATPGLKVGENGSWVRVGGGITSIELASDGDATSGNTITANGTLTLSFDGASGDYVNGEGNLVTFPTTDNYNYWTLSDGSTSTNITSTGVATFQGTDDEVEVAEASGTVTIGLPDDVTITSNLTVGGTGDFTGQVTIPILPVNSTDAASKDYVDSAVAGGLIYQGGFDGSTGYVAGTTNYLDSRGTQIAVNKGWTYTVTVAGTFYGENVEVGDVLIAEDDLASGAGALTDWTTVQNNIDLASDTQVGIGNVKASTANELKGIDVTYNTSGNAFVGLDIDSLTLDTLAEQPSDYFLPIYDGGGGINNKAKLSELLAFGNQSTSATGTITAGNLSGTVNHTFGKNTIVQTINASGDTVYCDVTRTGTVGNPSTSVATISVAEASDITILVQKIG